MAENKSKTDRRDGSANLIPLNQRSIEDQRIIQSMGGKAGSKVRKEKKELKDKLKIAMSLSLRPGPVTSLSDVDSFDFAKDMNMTLEDRMILQIARKAANGDPNLYLLYREELGQNPVEIRKVEATVTMIDNKKLNKMKKALDQNPEIIKALLEKDETH